MAHRLGQILRKRRRELEISQRELARMLGVSHGAVAQWEIDLSLPSIATRARLADILQMAPTDLMPEIDAGPTLTTVSDPALQRLIAVAGQLPPIGVQALLLAALALAEGYRSASPRQDVA